MTKDISINEEVAKLRWACRRGMLELDLMLKRFLDLGFLALPPEERAVFRELLACTDPDLFAWLLGGQQPTNPQFLPLLKKIQEHGHTANSLKTI